MKKLLLGLFFLACIGVSYAQSNNPETAIVKLKSGVEIRGVILDHVENVSVTIKTAEGDIFVYRASEVAQIDRPNAVSTRAEKRQKEEQIKLEAKNAKLEAKNAKKEMREKRALGNFKGYRGIIDVSVGYDFLGDSYTTSSHGRIAHELQTKFSFINGYNAGPGFYIGVGVGFNIHKDLYFTDYSSYGQERMTPYNGKSYSVPLFLHLRTSWAKNRKVSPFLSLSAGYSLDITGLPVCDEHNTLPETYFWCDQNCAPSSCYYTMTKFNKFFVEPSFGLEFRTSRKTAIIVAFTVPMHFAFGDLFYMSIPLGANIGFSF